ncbi:MAG: hypothetical protein MJY98_07525 [Fibrobacter sp.]|nr:hypothetical protein [Fibrobacter sp.]
MKKTFDFIMRMKKNLFEFFKVKFKKWIPFCEKWEENLHFPMGTYFFNFLGIIGIVVSVLAVVGGLLTVLYFCTPVFKTSVDKPEYQEKVQKIDADEVMMCAKPKGDRPKKKVRSTSAYQESYSKNELAEEGCRAPELKLEKLQAALPKVKMTQNGSVYICDTEEMKARMINEDWDYWDQQSRCYKKAIVPSDFAKKITNKLQNWYECDGTKQQEFIDKMVARVLKYEESERKSIFETSMEWYGEIDDVDELWNFWAEIDAVISQNTANAAKLFAELENFNLNNKLKGRMMTSLSLKLVALGKAEDRFAIFKSVRQGYKSLLITNGLDYETWESVTLDYLAMTSLHQNILGTLPCYYELVVEKDVERLSRNKELRLKYVTDSTAAEQEYSAARSEKNATGKVGLLIAGMGLAGVVLISVVISLLLLLYSIQRTLKRMECRLNEERKN